ncbi:MAG TPA: site-specific integrase [Candidatus Methanomethylicus sp.]|mgnify:CR=1 FL=1|nr:site-specific integrase [Candidatus Methanomethylicus sp.]HRR55098.1 site-specific integrase [Candidatus Methanomethylicus sp.]
MTSDQKLVLKDVPSWAEVEKIIGTLIRKHKQGSVSLRDLCIEGLLATTGIRTSELLALRKEDFDFKQCLVTVRQLKKKGEFVRQTVMSDDLKPYLEEYLKGVRGSRPAFDLTRRQVLNITHRYTAEIIGRPIRNHAFRHAYAIRILEKTRDLELCRRLIGHSELETVKIYLDFAIGDRAKEVGDAISIKRQATKDD